MTYSLITVLGNREKYQGCFRHANEQLTSLEKNIRFAASLTSIISTALLTNQIYTAVEYGAMAMSPVVIVAIISSLMLSSQLRQSKALLKLALHAVEQAMELLPRSSAMNQLQKNDTIRFVHSFEGLKPPKPLPQTLSGSIALLSNRYKKSGYFVRWLVGSLQISASLQLPGESRPLGGENPDRNDFLNSVELAAKAAEKN